MTSEIIIAIIGAAALIAASVIGAAARIHGEVKNVSEKTDKYRTEINGRLEQMMELVAKDAYKRGQESQE